MVANDECAGGGGGGGRLKPLPPGIGGRSGDELPGSGGGVAPTVTLTP